MDRKSIPSKPSFVQELIETFLCSLIVLLVIYWKIAMPEVVWGSSMEPNFYTGERIIVDKLFNKSDYKRGEVVVLNPPGAGGSDYIKRVIGLPGDVVKIFDCKVYIVQDDSRFVLEEPYLSKGTCTNEGTVIKEGRSFKLDKDEYVVLGDNRAVSADSRFFGTVNRDKILGRVVFRFWPISKIGFIK